jgi:hypothetical protein
MVLLWSSLSHWEDDDLDSITDCFHIFCLRCNDNYWVAKRRQWLVANQQADNHIKWCQSCVRLVRMRVLDIWIHLLQYQRLKWVISRVRSMNETIREMQLLRLWWFLLVLGLWHGLIEPSLVWGSHLLYVRVIMLLLRILFRVLCLTQRLGFCW